MEFNWKCPKCGHNVLRDLGGMSTSVYYPPIYEDGVNINPDRNIITHSYKCEGCKAEITVKSQYDLEDKTEALAALDELVNVIRQEKNIIKEENIHGK